MALLPKWTESLFFIFLFPEFDENIPFSPFENGRGVVFLKENENAIKSVEYFLICSALESRLDSICNFLFLCSFYIYQQVRAAFTYANKMYFLFATQNGCKVLQIIDEPCHWKSVRIRFVEFEKKSFLSHGSAFP